ncbi:hypothetical protein BJX68DRAFT_78584 [Aspergillus pseudodeflectus]|uniref:Secreted protein n=1 Tax=Aspergillus pseudodeflectus TaxID=176178 RepID=A0ABR4L720_9EURO
MVQKLCRKVLILVAASRLRPYGVIGLNPFGVGLQAASSTSSGAFRISKSPDYSRILVVPHVAGSCSDTLRGCLMPIGLTTSNHSQPSPQRSDNPGTQSPTPLNCRLDRFWMYEAGVPVRFCPHRTYVRAMIWLHVFFR